MSDPLYDTGYMYTDIQSNNHPYPSIVKTEGEDTASS